MAIALISNRWREARSGLSIALQVFFSILASPASAECGLTDDCQSPSGEILLAQAEASGDQVLTCADRFKTVLESCSVDLISAYMRECGTDSSLGQAFERFRQIEKGEICEEEILAEQAGLAEQQQQIAWQQAQSSDTRGAYESFLERFPSGENAPFAEAALRQSRFNKKYRQVTAEIQTLLSEEACLDSSQIDGFFGESSQRSLKTLIEKNAEQSRCTDINVPTVVRSRSEVPAGWIPNSEKTLSRLKQCLSTVERPACKAPDYFVYVRSTCKYAFRIFVVVYEPSGDWAYHGWYDIEPGHNQYSPLARDDGSPIVTQIDRLFYYAELIDRDYSWSGNLVRSFRGSEYGLREETLSSAKDPARISLGCSNL
ncbi:hypothetical protein [Palleronia caenipelagi]|uniref:DUF1311 domain-containing protein n=1 Tax=Palleronia caenipelagi TaxID=2489174 RepID=A0A547PUC0_9RHOB|nr:hypothetical protein [Palleronia caenipelagi]TRD17740.1 hypothetical protein FEV53_12750 [Palleronia caenipelagi]